VPATTRDDLRFAAVAAGVRAIVLLLGFAGLLSGGLTQQSAVALAVLAAAAIGATALSFVRPASGAIPIGEAFVAGVAILVGSPDSLPLAPYAAVPSFQAGLLGGSRRALLAVAACAPFVGLALLSRPERADLVALSWLLVAVGVGLLAGWVFRLREGQPRRDDASYQEIGQLLSELRGLVRPLSGGLDPRPLAVALLDASEAIAPAAGSAVVIANEAGVLIPASRGISPEIGWAGAGGGRDDSGYVTILRGHGDTSIPVSLKLLTEKPLPAELESRLAVLTDTWSTRLAAAALFEELQDLATRAERSRLAREMHDGVAQDVASLGYLVDGLMEQATPANKPGLRDLREEITRVVAELRMSIHDLRENGVRGSGLASGIAELARKEAAIAGIAVHIRQQEALVDLPAEVENDLYRLAQEAITNVRRHSQAQNMWVSCVVGPGGTVITVEDDGVGIPRDHNPAAEVRPDGLGLSFMTERAGRAGAELSVGPRSPSGTIVRVHCLAAPGGWGR